jgi:hypothetical protein
VQRAGTDLNSLRSDRNRADYDLAIAYQRGLVATQLQAARLIIQILDAIQEPIRTQITDGMKVYERDVLKDVTWHP